MSSPHDNPGTRGEPSAHAVYPHEERDRAMDLAVERLTWYRREARKSRLGYQYLELGQIVAGALVPVGVAVGWSTTVTAALGAGIVFAGGARAIFQWHDNWLSFIGAQMRIERELALYEVGAPPYAGADRAHKLVREVEQIALDETQAWSTRRQADRDPSTATAAKPA